MEYSEPEKEMVFLDPRTEMEIQSIKDILTEMASKLDILNQKVDSMAADGRLELRD